MNLITLDTVMPKTEVLAAAKAKRFASWRRSNDAAMVPDRGFTKQLKCLKETLEVKWDFGSEKWEIWDVPKPGEGAPYHIMTIQTKGKSYRELGTDVLVQMQRNIFMMNNLTTKQICDYFDEMDAQVHRRNERDFRNKISAIANETFLHAAGVLQVQVPRTLRIERSIADANA